MEGEDTVENIRQATLGLAGTIKDVVGMLHAVLVAISTLCQVLADRGVITEDDQAKIISGMKVEAQRVIGEHRD